ncbi:hypothetical protein [Leucobacter manosquensis]|uniref:Uncharacterized protein n=1 Tax=Leucobacter manosquensis TaxID=2810611 RepID=A0ABS5M5A8_9MICO|nr:hypothetical protein [Leucobacter manosquensis]MBS3182342.1 hypothetical protein [Leucobacter manosquensis]
MEQMMHPSNLAFFALAIAFVVRIRNAIRVPTARHTWLASGVGAVALLCCGTLISIPVLDGWLGGTNFLSLLQNVAAAVAFWLVAQAVVTQGHYPLHKLFRWPLYVGVFSFVIPFFLIERGATTQDFMLERSDQLAGFLYSCLYLALIAGICVYLIAKIWRSGAQSFATMHLGGAFVSVGCVLQILALASICFNWLPEGVSRPVYTFALTSFSGGVVLMAGNMAGLALLRLRSTSRVKHSIKSVESILRRKDLEVPARPAMTTTWLNGETALNHLYRSVIAVNDHVQADGSSLNNDEKKRVERASHLVSRKMFTKPRKARARLPRWELNIIEWAAKGSKSN